jgi:GGDEF domain-containing protein
MPSAPREPPSDAAPSGATDRPGTLVHFSAAGDPPPSLLLAFAADTGALVHRASSHDEVLARVNRSSPLAIVVDGANGEEMGLELCRTLKSDTFSAVIPLVVHTAGGSVDAAAQALEAGADEVITPLISDREAELRLRLAIWRADRDLSVNPTTRLPGTVQIDRDFSKRLEEGAPFAVCYADLDHFKEFNDRYGYNHGDKVILIVSRILRDVVRARSSRGFIGHIGGDDFIFTLALEDYELCCAEIVEIFDELIPLQYGVEDRNRGFFFGKDRRGVLYRVPLMTISIGVVTNQRRAFAHPAAISELATEMKTYAKSFAGSIFTVDRRSGDE